MMQLIRLSKAYGGAPAVDGVSLEIRDDEYLTLLGPSGCGKSTLLRLIAGLERPDAGSILVEGADIARRPTHLRRLGFVQQNYALFPHLDVHDNVAFGLRHRAIDPVTDPDILRRKVGAVLDLVGLAGLGDRAVGAISGGQKQRVSLARTLVTEPRFCLLDEPLGALDANLRERMTVELRRIREALGVTFIHVTGNETEALAMGDRMAVMDGGRLLQVAQPAEVFRAPATASVARYLNAYNLFEGTGEDGALRAGAERLALPPSDGVPSFCAVRYDAVTVEAADAPVQPGRAGLTARFVATEFLGPRVVHFFRRAGGPLVEVERRLRLAEAAPYVAGAPYRLTWALEDTLLFGPDGRCIAPMGRAA